MKKVLVTGAAGFIGSNFCNFLLKNKIDYDGVDNLSNGHISFLKSNDNFFMLDFCNQKILEKIKNKNYDFVVHFAANPRVGYSVEHPIESNDTNVTKTLLLLDACKNNIKRFIFASSSSVYGEVKSLPVLEKELILNPNSPYGLQKLIIEQYLKLYNQLYGLDSVSLRFFNVYGENQLGSSPYATAISSWLTAIKNNQPMRSDGDGSQSRDMCHVTNVVDCVHKAIMYGNNLNATPINVATGESTTNNKIMDLLLKRYPQASKYDAPWRIGDVMHTLADINKAENILGYKPLINLEEGLQMTADWFDNNWNSIKNLSQKV